MVNLTQQYARPVRSEPAKAYLTLFNIDYRQFFKILSERTSSMEVIPGHPIPTYDVLLVIEGVDFHDAVNKMSEIINTIKNTPLREGVVTGASQGPDQGYGLIQAYLTLFYDLDGSQFFKILPSHQTPSRGVFLVMEGLNFQDAVDKMKSVMYAIRNIPFER